MDVCGMLKPHGSSHLLSPRLLLLLQDLSVFSSIKGTFITYLYGTPYYVIVVYCVECLDALKMRKINEENSSLCHYYY